MSVGSPLVKAMAKPVCRLADSVLRHLPPLKPTKPGCRVKEIDTATLLDLILTLPKRSLLPQYDLASLQWLVTMAEQSESEGTLAKQSVETAAGRTLGWFVYYRNRGGFGRVLQLAAFSRSMELVLDSLIYDAKQAGVAALWGRTEPEHAMLLTERHCLFQGRPWVLVHSSRPEIVQSFQVAECALHRLRGRVVDENQRLTSRV